ncbi:MAG: hypothetical protein KAG66_07765, partial [Methylococcales bacterium]|nr:hypothetical protein [Methylococcales bacterium]
CLGKDRSGNVTLKSELRIVLCADFLEKSILEGSYCIRILSKLRCPRRLVDRFDRPFTLRVLKPIQSNMG